MATGTRGARLSAEAAGRPESALRAARAITWEADLATGRVARSGSVAEMLGALPATMEAFLQRVHPEDRPRAEAALAAARAGERLFNLEFRLIGPREELLWVHETGELRLDSAGRPMRLVGITVDITDRKTAEIELTALKNRLAADLAGLLRLQLLAQHLVRAERPETLFEDIVYTAAALAGTEMASLQLAEGGTGPLRLVAQRGLAPPLRRFLEEAAVRRAPFDGAAARLESLLIEDVETGLADAPGARDALTAAGVRALQVTPLGSRAGRLLGALAAYWREPQPPAAGTLPLLDLLAGQVAAHLERAAALEALEAAKQEAERAAAAKARFLATASHDLRQPFQAIRLFQHLIEKEAPAGRLGELLRRQSGAIDSAEALLNELLEYSRLETGAVEIDTERFALRPFLERLASEARVQGDAKRLRVRCRPGAFEVETDPVLLGRILRNLLSNALRYTERGGILLACRRRGERVWVEVWGTGPGIPEDKREAIFAEFYRGTAKGVFGLGIGLATVRLLADRLGLAVRLRSEVGRGSVFGIGIPLPPRGAGPDED